MASGRFITLEGIDGAGKSTHLDWIAKRFASQDWEVVVTREPGGTPLGEKLRSLLLSEPMHLETEALLMFAARREHLERVIHPALARGACVISDRFTDASFAYQGGGRGLDIRKLTQLESWVQGDFQPDLTLIFDLPIEVSRERMNGTRELDRFEREKDEFFQRVRAAYLDRARQSPGRIRVIDATRTVPEIQEELQGIFSSI